MQIVRHRTKPFFFISLHSQVLVNPINQIKSSQVLILLNSQYIKHQQTSTSKHLNHSVKMSTIAALVRLVTENKAHIKNCTKNIEDHIISGDYNVAMDNLKRISKLDNTRLTKDMKTNFLIIICKTCPVKRQNDAASLIYYLLSHGANAEAEDFTGKSAIEYCEEKGLGQIKAIFTLTLTESLLNTLFFT